jgi:two-component system, NarL family, sensor histidine kinase UhpB
MSDEVAFSDIPFFALVEQSLAGVYVVLDEKFMYANDTFAAMFGYRRDEFIGMHIANVVTPDSVDEVMSNYRIRISGEVPSIRYFTRGVHRDGHVVHLELHASRVECGGRPALCGVAVDVSERMMREVQLRESQEQLRDLADYVLRSLEEQRAKFARELHDVLGGMLTSIKMDVTRILRRIATNEMQDIQSIGSELLALVQETIDTTRNISDELRPRILDAMGLVAAIRDALHRFGARHGIETSFVLQGTEPQLSPQRAIQCYRILQEALTNIARHANARTVSVTVNSSGSGMELRVQDDGCGFDVDSVSRNGIGLISMAERAREMGGTLDVYSSGIGATMVFLQVPTTNSGRSSDD